VHGEKHYNLIKEPIEKHTEIECLGYLNFNKDIVIESQYLGLIPSGEIDELNKKMNVLAVN